MRKKILYGVQGTGNGHIARSKEVINALLPYADVDVLISGTQHEIHFPLEVKYRFSGIQFVFGKTGGIDYVKSLIKIRLLRSFLDVISLPRVYDLVISDFEPISAYFAKIRGVRSVAISHQCSLILSGVPLPEVRSRLAEWIIRHFAPCTESIGLHFCAYHPDILPPIIRKEVRDAGADQMRNCSTHHVVYLPAFDHQPLMELFSRTGGEWVIFSKHHRGPPFRNESVEVYPVGHEVFLEKFITCKGLLTNAGFETPAEALFLGKKILAVPMRGQYEQECNAVALKKLGATIAFASLSDIEHKVSSWLLEVRVPERIDFMDPVPDIVKRIMTILA